MSKFFRSTNPETSSSEDDSEGSASSIGQVDGEDYDSEISGTLSSLNPGRHGLDNGLQSQMLLHAIIERDCTREALEELVLQGQHRNEELVNRLVKAKYQYKISMLAPVLSSGLDREELASTRQRFRDGYQALSRSAPSATRQASFPVPPRRLLTYGNTLSETQASLHALALPHPILEPSRYHRDFDELAVLGRGGYGVVYHVRNKLDGLEYAVKKIPVSQARIVQIRQRGQQQLDELLLELRTLARLDHSNIVRYYNGWIEWTNVVSPPGFESDLSQSTAGRAFSDEGEDTKEGAPDNRRLRRIVTESDSAPVDVVFEDSLSPLRIPNTEGTPKTPSVPYAGASTSGRSLMQEGATESDTNNALSSNGGSSLALHVQMGVYPMTLADFLSPVSRSPNTAAEPLVHCFHLQPSISILLALIDGVEYLHGFGIAHRDLKPANIFIAANNNPRSTRGSVDLLLCSECRAAGEAHPMTLDVRIGDFGLVAALAHSGAAANTAVGTEIYRPVTVQTSNVHLDIYALGIIAFELLCKFGTRMERYGSIQALKGDGAFPPHFTVDSRGLMPKCIKDMLAHDSGVTLNSIRDRLKAAHDPI